MADYYPLIVRAVAGLPQNTEDARRALYDRARNALVAQPNGQTPTLSESEVIRERRLLEEAIRKVEAEVGKTTLASLGKIRGRNAVALKMVAAFLIVGAAAIAFTTKAVWLYPTVGFIKEGSGLPPAAPEVYRQVISTDGIRFYSQAHSVMFSGGGLHEQGFECGVIGDDGRKIAIALASTTVDDGQIQTKDFGILKHEAVSPTISKLFATESQIKKLQTLQSSRLER